MPQSDTEKPFTLSQIEAIISPEHKQSSAYLHTRQLSMKMLDCTSVYTGPIKPNSDALMDYVCQLAEFDLETDDKHLNEAVMTTYGKAVSPQTAVACYREYMRNFRFQSGLLLAIQDQLQKRTCNKPLQILYAGTGPLATIIIPALMLLKPKDVQFTLLDISETSLGYLKNLINRLDVNEFVKAYVVADATDWQPADNERYDIIISETMKAVLVQEPQVFIMAHLVQYLRDSGIFVPSNIKIDAALYHHESETKRMMQQDTSDAIETVVIGKIFDLNKESAQTITAEGYQKAMCGELSLDPDINLSQFDSIYYRTDIEIFPGSHLEYNQCSLNTPMVVRLSDCQLTNKISFKYQIEQQYPQFVFEYS